jgi:hypothetical protein
MLNGCFYLLQSSGEVQQLSPKCRQLKKSEAYFYSMSAFEIKTHKGTQDVSRKAAKFSQRRKVNFPHSAFAFFFAPLHETSTDEDGCARGCR